MYKILESRIEFKNNQIQKITVLIDCTSGSSKPLSDVRAIVASTQPTSGYMSIPPSAKLTDELLQQVAAQGSITHDANLIFSNWKKRFIS